MSELLWLLIAVVAVALIFDFINGFHDAANAIATVVATGVLRVTPAVIFAAILNFAGAFAGTAVAGTIAKGFADAAIVTQGVVLSALIGACIWNLLTWWWGIPSSSSHALIGGLCGAVVGHAGISAFNWTTLGLKVLLPLVLSPLAGFILAYMFMLLINRAVRGVPAKKATRASKKLQLFSAGAMAFSHGSNDAQKAMGIITLAVLAYVAGGSTLPAWVLPAEAGKVPHWVVYACASAIGLGTMAGGKKIIKTMGTKIFKISPLNGFAAESAGALVILTASFVGIPLSTTHCINGCLMGVGASKRLTAVRWTESRKILVAWVVTLPASALMAMIAVWFLG